MMSEMIFVFLKISYFLEETVYKCHSFFFLNNIYLFTWLFWVLVVASGIFSCGTWDLVPWPEVEPRTPRIGTIGEALIVL